MINRLGFCCILKSEEKNNKYKVNRRFQKYEHFLNDKNNGYILTSQKIIDNIKGTIAVLTFCHNNNINMYRMSSAMIPNIGEYQLENLPNYDKIVNLFKGLGKLVKKYDIRVGFHPDHFVKLASPKSKIVYNSINALNIHGDILDFMELEQTPYYYINIHIGGSYNDKIGSLARFRYNTHLLKPSTLKRLTIENDDKKGGYTVKDLYDHITKHTNIPIVYDQFHHELHSLNYDETSLTKQQAVEYFVNSWSNLNITPLSHHSSSKKLYEDTTSNNVAHADYIYNQFETFNNKIDVELECKAKELGLFNYKKQLL